MQREKIHGSCSAVQDAQQTAREVTQARQDDAGLQRAEQQRLRDVNNSLKRGLVNKNGGQLLLGSKNDAISSCIIEHITRLVDRRPKKKHDCINTLTLDAQSSLAGSNSLQGALNLHQLARWAEGGQRKRIAHCERSETAINVPPKATILQKQPEKQQQSKLQARQQS